jgi:selenide,water dikinase
LPRVPRLHDDNVLVGFDTSDDAGVYRLSPECALVQTVDFFTPIVDDPRTFGAVAAANALSDVYAMGGRPLTALSILAYPQKGDLDELTEILQGGAEKMAEAGCVILGGHSINDAEIKFGYAVTGLVHPGKVVANRGARPGDVLYLSKPLGTGVIATALKRGIASLEHVERSVASMLTLNKAAAEAMVEAGAHAATDVTGFGLLGHAREVALASEVTLEFDAAAIEFLPGALDYARAGAIPGGLKNNTSFVGCDVWWHAGLDEAVKLLLCDPQTSGGLLIAAPRAIPGMRAIGGVLKRKEKLIHVL